MGIKFCPNCRSEKVVNVRGDNLMWRCINCGLEMPTFPEKSSKNKSKRFLKSKGKLNE